MNDELFNMISRDTSSTLNAIIDIARDYSLNLIDIQESRPINVQSDMEMVSTILQFLQMEQQITNLQEHRYGEYIFNMKLINTGQEIGEYKILVNEIQGDIRISTLGKI